MSRHITPAETADHLIVTAEQHILWEQRKRFPQATQAHFPGSSRASRWPRK